MAADDDVGLAGVGVEEEGGGWWEEEEDEEGAWPGARGSRSPREADASMATASGGDVGGATPRGLAATAARKAARAFNEGP